MQGYILAIHRTRDEDLIVSILTASQLLTLYRFYGARHSTINVGYKIDFETESDGKSSISRLRNILHLGYEWLYDRERMLVWQQFIQLFYPHLRDNETVDRFYFDLIEEAARLWNTQNPKRIAIEAYAKLLEFEGRLHAVDFCFLCEMPIIEDPALVRAYLSTHAHCSHGATFKKKSIEKLLYEKNAILLDDKEVAKLYEVLRQGI